MKRSPSRGIAIPSQRQPPASAATPRGRWLLCVRIAWILVALLSVALVVLSAPARYAVAHDLCTAASCKTLPLLSPAGARTLRELGLSVDFFAVQIAGVNVVLFLAFFAAAVVIFVRKSADWMAIFVSFALMIIGVVGTALLDALVLQAPQWRLPVAIVRALGIALFVLLWYLFPNGRFVPRWTCLLAVAVVLWALIWPFTPLVYGSSGWSAVFLGLVATGVLAQVHGYRRVASPLERQQTKWVVVGAAAALVGLTLAVLIPPLLLPDSVGRIDAPVSNLQGLVYHLVVMPLVGFGALLLLPLSVTLSILRFRLWDVDPVINRTLVYGVLSVALVGLYGGGVLVLQQLLHALTGQQSPLAVVGSTLASVVLFQPLRVRIQASIDRRFYRHKYDAVQTLQAFSTKLRDEVDLDMLTGELLAVVEETLQPAHVSLWLPRNHISGPELPSESS